MWQKCYIRPIPKSSLSDKRIPTNYRGISLLSNIYKLYASIINARLTTFLEQNGKIVEEQNGFRQLRACIDHLFVISSIIKNRRIEGKDTYACFVDMRRAFDVIDRTSLLYKLSTVGVCKNLYDSIAVIYANTECSVMIGEYLTDWFQTLGGVKQGDNLSPKIFSVYINDLATELNSMNLGIQVDDTFVNILLYADDIVILAESEQNLQTMMDHIHEWCRKWRMSINAMKTNVVHFRKASSKRTDFKFSCGPHDIIVVEKYKYLGCVLEETLNFSHTANMLADSASRATGAIVTKCKNNHLGYQTFNKLYHSCVTPIMDYAAGVWGYSNYDRPNTVQNRALRSFLGVHRYASNVVIQGDVGWDFPVVRRRLQMIKLLQRIMKMDDSRLTKKVLMWDWKHKGRTWSYNVRSILRMADVNLNPSSKIEDLDYDYAIKTVRCKLMEQEISKWEFDKGKQSKLRLYTKLKDSYSTELYVSKNMSRSCRSFIAQLRTGTLPINIEIGRFQQKAIEERICPGCNDDSVEDEIHFIFKCPLYAGTREAFMNDVLKYYPNIKTKDCIEQLIDIMNDSNLVSRLGAFIRDCYFIRITYIYSVKHN